MSGNELNYKNNRSGIMVNGVGRSGNRALLYSMGLEEDDFRKPIIGIANSFSELVPGHIHLRGPGPGCERRHPGSRRDPPGI